MATTTTPIRQGLSGSLAIKVPCVAASTGNLTLSGEQTVDGVACVTGDRVLVKDQTTGSENGVYDVSTAAWTRSLDFDGNGDVTRGTIVPVLDGTTNSNTSWRLSSTGTITIGTSSLTFAESILVDASTASFLQAGSNAVARTVQSKLRDIFSVKDFDAAGDGITDDTTALQNALDAAVGNILWAPAGTYIISQSLKYSSQTFLKGDGFGTVIKASGSWAATIPTINASTYTPVLDYAPLLYNQSSIQWWSIEDIQFNGNSQSCYGIWFAENYYGSMRNVYVLGCGQRAYTNIRGQAVGHHECVFYQSGGVLSYDNTNFSFDNCGFERLNGDWYYDQRQPSAGFNKGGVVVNDCWFEDDATYYPNEGYLRMSGRRNQANIHAGFTGTASTERVLELNDTTDSVTVDSINMGAAAVIMGNFVINNTTGAMFILAKAGTKYNNISGFYTVANVTDNGSVNNFDLRTSLTVPCHHVTGRFQVRNASSDSMDLAENNAVLDADPNAGGDPFIRYFFTNNNYMTLNAGNLIMRSNLQMQLYAGSSATTSTIGSTVQLYFDAAQYAFAGSGNGSSGWQRPVRFGAYALWVDSAGVLRINNGNPTSNFDGTVVGSQTT